MLGEGPDLELVAAQDVAHEHVVFIKVVVELGVWLDDHGHGACCGPEALLTFEEGCKDWWELMGVPKHVDCVLVHPLDSHVWALCQHCVWDKESHPRGEEECPGPWAPVEGIFYL